MPGILSRDTEFRSWLLPPARIGPMFVYRGPALGGILLRPAAVRRLQKGGQTADAPRLDSYLVTDSPSIRLHPGLPTAPHCSDCGVALSKVFGWCGGCREAYCFSCGREHFCTPQCPAKGCYAGLCVREVRDGVLSETWGLPPA